MRSRCRPSISYWFIRCINTLTVYAAASGWPKSIQKSVPYRWPSKVTPVGKGAKDFVNQLSLPVRIEFVALFQPCLLKTCWSLIGGPAVEDGASVGFLVQTDDMITKACTSIPSACAVAIKSASGSKPTAIGTKSGAGSSDLKYQESPRRRTWAKITFAFADFAALTAATTLV